MKHKHTLKLILLLVFGAFLSASILACKAKDAGSSADGNRKPNAEAKEELNQEKAKRGRGSGATRSTYVYSVVAATVVPTIIIDTITVGGDIQAKNVANIHPDTSGTLHSIRVVEGEDVNRGEIIAYVNPSKAGQKFKLSPVLASINGTVTSLPITLGNTVGPQSTIATISDNSEIEMKTNIPEKYVGKIAKGTEGRLSVIAYPNNIYDMKLLNLSKSLSSITHSMPVTFAFVQQNNNLKSGMYGNLEVILERREDVFVVQRDVILIRLVNNISTIGVFVLNTDIPPNAEGVQPVKFIPVTLGIEDNDNRLEVKAGLNEGDVVIVQGQDSLSEGSMVRIFVLDGEERISMEAEIERLRKDEDNNADTRTRKPGQR